MDEHPLWVQEAKPELPAEILRREIWGDHSVEIRKTQLKDPSLELGSEKISSLLAEMLRRIFIPWLLLDWKFAKRTDLNLGHTPDLLQQNLKMDYRNSCSQCKFRRGAHLY